MPETTQQVFRDAADRHAAEATGDFGQVLANVSRRRRRRNSIRIGGLVLLVVAGVGVPTLLSQQSSPEVAGSGASPERVLPTGEFERKRSFGEIPISTLKFSADGCPYLEAQGHMVGVPVFPAGSTLDDTDGVLTVRDAAGAVMVRGDEPFGASGGYFPMDDWTTSPTNACSVPGAPEGYVLVSDIVTPVGPGAGSQ